MKKYLSRYCVRDGEITLKIGHTPAFKEFRVPKFIGKYKGSKIANTVLKNNKVGRLTLPDFRT